MRSSISLGVMGVVGVAVILGLAACSSDGGNDTATDTSAAATADSGRILLTLPDSRPGDVIALRVGDDGRTIEWIDRRAGTIRAVTLPAGAVPSSLSVDDIQTLATVDVGIEGEQRGLLGHTVIDGVRYAAWTDPDTFDLIVGEVGPDGVERVVWDGGGTAGGAVGGHLEASDDGQLILGIGQLTDWAKTNGAETNGSGSNGSGAMVRLDPDGPADQEPVILSDGYTNPFAFAVVDGELWVADNAVGDDVERIGRGDLADRDEHSATGRDPRAPSAVVALPATTPGDTQPDTRPGTRRLGVCGFLDAQLLAWTTGTSTGTSTGAAGTSTGTADGTGYGTSLGPCLTGAAVLPDGTIVTATADGLVLLPT